MSTFTQPPKGVADHPAKEKMEELWKAGNRASAIYEFLASEGYPLVSVSTIGKYGQRNWNPSSASVTLDSDASVADIQGVIDEFGDIGFVPDKVTHSSKNSWGWEKQEDGSNIQVERDISSKSIQFKFSSQSSAVADCDDDCIFLHQALIPDISIVSKAPTSLSEPSRPLYPTGTLERPRNPSDGHTEASNVELRLAVSIPDIQIGYYDDPERDELEPTHDEQALNVAHQVMFYMEQQHGIDLIVNQGDNLDLPAFSSHRTPPNYVTNKSTQASINRYSAELATQRRLSPQADIIDLPSNHQIRLVNTLIDKVPSLVGIKRAGGQEPVVSIPYLCRYDDYGVRMPEGGWPDGKFWAAPNLLFMHGSLTSSTPGGTARKYLRDNVSVVYGHRHLSETLYNISEGADRDRVSFAGTAGCLCRVDGSLPSSRTGSNDEGRLAGVQREKWTQGIWFIWYDPTGNVDPVIEPCVIDRGVSIFRGQLFATNVDIYGREL